MRIYFFQDERRTKRWNVKVFSLLFGQTLFNAFIVYPSNTAVPMLYRKLLENVDSLGDFRMPAQLGIGGASPHDPSPAALSSPTRSLDLSCRSPDCEISCKCEQMLQGLFGKGDEDRKVRFCCKRCNFGLCVVNCFWSYHTLIDFWLKPF